jgi:hypothetical protein
MRYYQNTSLGDQNCLVFDPSYMRVLTIIATQSQYYYYYYLLRACTAHSREPLMLYSCTQCVLYVYLCYCFMLLVTSQCYTIQCYYCYELAAHSQELPMLYYCCIQCVRYVCFISTSRYHMSSVSEHSALYTATFGDTFNYSLQRCYTSSYNARRWGLVMRNCCCCCVNYCTSHA